MPQLRKTNTSTLILSLHSELTCSPHCQCQAPVSRESRTRITSQIKHTLCIASTITVSSTSKKKRSEPNLRPFHHTSITRVKYLKCIEPRLILGRRMLPGRDAVTSCFADRRQNAWPTSWCCPQILPGTVRKLWEWELQNTNKLPSPLDKFEQST